MIYEQQLAVSTTLPSTSLLHASGAKNNNQPRKIETRQQSNPQQYRLLYNVKHTETRDEQAEAYIFHSASSISLLRRCSVHQPQFSLYITSPALLDKEPDVEE